MRGSKKLIFDASAVNALTADVDLDAIIRALRYRYHVGITETVLAEIVAHPEETERRGLLKCVDYRVHP